MKSHKPWTVLLLIAIAPFYAGCDCKDLTEASQNAKEIRLILARIEASGDETTEKLVKDACETLPFKKSVLLQQGEMMRPLAVEQCAEARKMERKKKLDADDEPEIKKAKRLCAAGRELLEGLALVSEKVDLVCDPEFSHDLKDIRSAAGYGRVAIEKNRDNGSTLLSAACKKPTAFADLLSPPRIDDLRATDRRSSGRKDAEVLPADEAPAFLILNSGAATL